MEVFLFKMSFMSISSYKIEGEKITYEYKTFDFNIRILMEGVSLFLFIVSYFIMGICLRHGLLSLWKNYIVSESAAEKRTMFCCVKTLSGLLVGKIVVCLYLAVGNKIWM